MKLGIKTLLIITAACGHNSTVDTGPEEVVAVADWDEITITASTGN
jgi:hypothetical protein